MKNFLIIVTSILVVKIIFYILGITVGFHPTALLSKGTVYEVIIYWLAVLLIASMPKLFSHFFSRS